ncbi:hypothetical protein D3C85_1278060 [compost metagenome]
MPNAARLNCAATGGTTDQVGTASRYKGIGAAPGTAAGSTGASTIATPSAAVATTTGAATGTATMGTSVGGKAGSGLATATTGGATTEERKYQLFSLPGVIPPLNRR